jgi:hypothetical protein
VRAIILVAGAKWKMGNLGSKHDFEYGLEMSADMGTMKDTLAFTILAHGTMHYPPPTLEA